MKKRVSDKYSQFYKSIGFERLGLFELIKDEFNPATVLYPGCSIHVTPSFYFNHVVYVDTSQLSIDFFANKNDVSGIINENKTFPESSYWHFLPKDFQSDLGLRTSSFDLLLSLFSGKLINYCEKYVKFKGFVLTNSLFSDNDSIKNRNDFKLLGLIQCKNFTYHIDYKMKSSKETLSKLRQRDKGFEYIDNENYYVYQKMKRDGTGAV